MSASPTGTRYVTLLSNLCYSDKAILPILQDRQYPRAEGNVHPCWWSSPEVNSVKAWDRNCSSGPLAVMGDPNEFYLRYYQGHHGKWGHEFIEFEFRPDGRVRGRGVHGI